MKPKTSRSYKYKILLNVIRNRIDVANEKKHRYNSTIMTIDVLQKSGNHSVINNEIKHRHNSRSMTIDVLK